MHRMKLGQLKDIRINFCALALLLLTGPLAFSLEMNELPLIPGSVDSGYSNYQRDTPPEISSVLLEPVAPKADAPVKVIITLTSNPDKTPDIPTGGILYFSTSGGTSWQSADLEDAGAGKGLGETKWSAEIPPQPAGTQVVFYVSAWDSAGNMSTEIPIMNTKWPPDDSMLYLTSKDEDERDQVVPQNLDVLETYFGYDEKYFYYKLVLQAPPSEGTMNPPFLHAYTAGTLSLDKGPDILGAYLLAYMPSLYLSSYPDTVLYDVGAVQFNFGADASKYIKDKALYLRFKRSAVGTKPDGKLRLMYGTAGALTLQLGKSGGTLVEGGLINILEDKLRSFRQLLTVQQKDLNDIRQFLSFQDATPYSNVYLRSHTFTAE